MKDWGLNPIAEFTLFLKRGSGFITVVGILQDGIIYTDPKAAELFDAGNFDDIVSDDRAKFMAAMDLGVKWQQLASCEPFIVLSHNTKEQK